MPNTANAKKALRKSEKRRLLNRTKRTALRGILKKVRVAVEAGNQDVARESFRLACKKLDQAAAKNLIHKNAAARTKSRLSALLKKTFSTAATE